MADSNNGNISIDNYYNNIISAQFIGGINQYDKKTGTEVVDVVTEYQWALNPPNMTGQQNVLAAVPFVYAVEYKQKYGATATNLVNNLYAIKNVGKDVLENLGLKQTAIDVGKTLQKHYNKMKDSMMSVFSENGVVESNQESTKESVVGVTGTERHGSSFMGKNGLLDPYKHLYILEPTQKRFCFPMLTDSATLSISNDFGAQGSTGLLSAGISKTIDEFANNILGFASDIQDISNYLNLSDSKGGNNFVMYNIEKAKAYSFPTTGKTISVKFPLFNTTKVDSWKDNYKFIMLFIMRNMLFRRDEVTYFPPLIYDVTTAGWGRMPLSFVKQFSVKSCGMIRTMQFDVSQLGLNAASNNKKTTVNVPEAWIVEIQFQSLIADSSNQILSSIIDLPISANPVTFNSSI